MTVPMIVLAVLTVLGGVLNLPFRSAEWLSRWLAPVFADAPEPAGASFAEGAALAGAALAVSAVGIAAARHLYRHGLGASDPLTARLGPAARVLENAFWIDRAYTASVGGPGRRLAAWLADVLDRTVVDGAVNGAAWVVRRSGEWMRRLQSGQVRQYALAIAAGAVLLVLGLVMRSW